MVSTTFNRFNPNRTLKPFCVFIFKFKALGYALSVIYDVQIDNVYKLYILLLRQTNLSQLKNNFCKMSLEHVYIVSFGFFCKALRK